MYNELQKQKFIFERYGADSKRIEEVFNTIAPKEEELGKDVSEFSSDEIQDIVSNRIGRRNSTGKSLFKFVCEYLEWCGKNQIPVAADISKVVAKSNARNGNEFFSSPAHIKLCLDQAYRVPECNPSTTPLKCLVWLLFSGIDVDNACEVKNSDIDFENLLIHYNGIDYPLYRESIPDFKNAVNKETFVYFHPKYDPVERVRMKSDYVLRGLKTPKMSYEYVKQLKRKNEELEKKFVPRSIIKSGIYYRIYEIERMGFPADLSEEIDRQMKNRDLDSPGYRYKNTALNNVRFNVKAEYELWKSVCT